MKKAYEAPLLEKVGELATLTKTSAVGQSYVVVPD